MPNLVPYRVNHVSVDPHHASDSIEFTMTGKDIIPRANTSHLVKFDTISGEPILFDIVLADGTFPPMMATAHHKDKLVGYVVQGGRLFVRGIEQKGTLNIIWGDNPAHQCQVNYELPHSTQERGLKRYTVLCVQYKEKS